MYKRPRFLVLRGGAIGDFIMTVPALQAIRTRWPDAVIELIGYPHIARLALAAELVDKVGSLDEAGMARFFSHRPSFTQAQIEFVRSFDLVFSYLHDPGGIVRQNLLAAGARQVIYGSPIVEEGHAVEHLMKPLEKLAIYGEREVPRLKLAQEFLEQGRGWLSGQGLGPECVALHPGSGSERKNWPARNFIELSRRLRAERGQASFFIIGEADAEAAAVLACEAAGAPVLAGRGLAEVAAVLAGCRAYVGNDSGITHIAAAVGIAVVALFGPSDPDRWGPRGPRVAILTGGDGQTASIAVEDVLRAL